jgi:hypothetical protein
LDKYKYVTELERGLVDLNTTSYTSIDRLMRTIMKKHGLTAKELHNAFVHKHNQTPDTWIAKRIMQENKQYKIRKELEQAYDLGSRVLSQTQTHISNYKILTPEEVLKQSGGKAIEKQLKQKQNRKNKAIDKLVKKRMKTLREFLYIAEKYYGPNEKLPSGKTPVEKAEARQERPAKTLRARDRKIRHKYRLERSVRRGADSRSVDISRHPDLDIEYKGGNHVFKHKPTGIKYEIGFYGTDKHGNDYQSIEWEHSHKNPRKMSDKTRRNTLKNALHVWDNHIEHRLPYGSTAHNSPEFNKDGRLTRAKLYQRRGFGPPATNPHDRYLDQYAKVGRNPSPKQKLKGKYRLKPLSAEDVYD